MASRAFEKRMNEACEVDADMLEARQSEPGALGERN